MCSEKENTMKMGHSRHAAVKGGWGRSLLNKVSKSTKHKINRRVHKQYRQEIKKDINDYE